MWKVGSLTGEDLTKGTKRSSPDGGFDYHRDAILTKKLNTASVEKKEENNDNRGRPPQLPFKSIRFCPNNDSSSDDSHTDTHATSCPEVSGNNVDYDAVKRAVHTDFQQILRVSTMNTSPSPSSPSPQSPPSSPSPQSPGDSRSIPSVFIPVVTSASVSVEVAAATKPAGACRDREENGRGRELIVNDQISDTYTKDNVNNNDKSNVRDLDTRVGNCEGLDRVEKIVEAEQAAETAVEVVKVKEETVDVIEISTAAVHSLGVEGGVPRAKPAHIDTINTLNDCNGRQRDDHIDRTGDSEGKAASHVGRGITRLSTGPHHQGHSHAHTPSSTTRRVTPTSTVGKTKSPGGKKWENMLVMMEALESQHSMVEAKVASATNPAEPEAESVHSQMQAMKAQMKLMRDQLRNMQGIISGEPASKIATSTSTGISNTTTTTNNNNNRVLSVPNMSMLLPTKSRRTSSDSSYASNSSNDNSSEGISMRSRANSYTGITNTDINSTIINNTGIKNTGINNTGINSIGINNTGINSRNSIPSVPGMTKLLATLSANGSRNGGLNMNKSNVLAALQRMAPLMRSQGLSMPSASSILAVTRSLANVARGSHPRFPASVAPPVSSSPQMPLTTAVPSVPDLIKAAQAVQRHMQQTSRTQRNSMQQASVANPMIAAAAAAAAAAMKAAAVKAGAVNSTAAANATTAAAKSLAVSTLGSAHNPFMMGHLGMFPPSMTAMMPYMRPPMNMLPFLMQSQAAAAQMQAHYAMANKSMKPMSRSGGPSSVRSLKAVNDILAAQKIKAEIAEMTANPSPPLLYSPHTNVSQAGGAPGHPLGQMSASLPTEGQKMATVKKARPEKSYICDFPGCSASFGRRFCLKRHQKRHTRVRPHACTYKGCDKKFAETSTLKRHIQAHLGSRPYKCGAPGCERRFADRANVCRHEKSMHNCMYTTVRSRATRSPNNSILPVEETAAVGLASSSSSPSSPGTAAPVVAASPAAPVDLNPRGAES